jgi:hypothetical protein
MLNPGNNALALLIAEALKNRCTHETLPGVAEDVGFALGEATSKRDRVLAGLKTADRKTLGAIAEHVGRRSPTSIWKKLGASFLRRESHRSARLRGATLRRRSGTISPASAPSTTCSGRCGRSTAWATYSFPGARSRSRLFSI